MAALAGLLNRPATEPRAMVGKVADPMAAVPEATNSSGSSSGTSASISSNDFLTLLVTEMKNQDPTANTDPNEYINQLVQVNSLEQLISINQTLGTALGSTGHATSGSAGSGRAMSGDAAQSLTAASSTTPAAAGASAVASPGPSVAPRSSPAVGTASGGVASAISRFADSVGAGRALGNLSIPAASASAHRVAQALGGQRPAHEVSGKLSGLK